MFLKKTLAARANWLIKSAAVLALSFFFSATAQAEDSGKEVKSNWDASLGIGLVAAPAYEGSKHYLASPIPMVAISWHDTVSLGTNGLSIYHKAKGFRYGVGVTYDPGRKDNGKNLFGMSSGDHRLEGMGNINPAAAFKTFISYDLHLSQDAPLIVIDASAIKLTGRNNSGVLIRGGISMPYQLNQNWRMVPNINTTWANDRYMNDYFGVTPEQATRSQFSTYKAKAGIKDVGIGLNVTYKIDKNWFVSCNGRGKMLLGGAASSPVSATNIDASIATLVGYHF